MNWILEFLFGCSHRRTTFPITPTRHFRSVTNKATYIVCLDCGKEFGYNWKAMKVSDNMDTAMSTDLRPQQEPKQ